MIIDYNDYGSGEYGVFGPAIDYLHAAARQTARFRPAFPKRPRGGGRDFGPPSRPAVAEYGRARRARPVRARRARERTPQSPLL